MEEEWRMGSNFQGETVQRKLSCYMGRKTFEDMYIYFGRCLSLLILYNLSRQELWKLPTL